MLSPSGCSAPRAEADDAVQETWLKLARLLNTDAVENLAGWLTTAHRPGLPGPPSLPGGGGVRTPPTSTRVAGDEAAVEADPEQETVLADSVGSALVVVLDLLGARRAHRLRAARRVRRALRRDR